MNPQFWPSSGPKSSRDSPRRSVRVRDWKSQERFPYVLERRLPTVYAAKEASGANVDQAFRDDAYDLGKRIAEEGWTQVNGGAHTGLMASSTAGGLDANGTVDCVILEKFVDESLPEGFGHVDIRATMPERKRGLYERGDAFVALPGGLGTLDELAEVMCLRQLSFHQKPIVLVNTSGFYNDIKNFIDNGLRQNFIAEGIDKVIHFAGSPAGAIGFLKAYKPIKISKDAVNSSEMSASENVPR